MSTENFMYHPFSPRKSGSFGLGPAIAKEMAKVALPLPYFTKIAVDLFVNSWHNLYVSIA